MGLTLLVLFGCTQLTTQDYRRACVEYLEASPAYADWTQGDKDPWIEGCTSGSANRGELIKYDDTEVQDEVIPFEPKPFNEFATKDIACEQAAGWSKYGSDVGQRIDYRLDSSKYYSDAEYANDMAELKWAGHAEDWYAANRMPDSYYPDDNPTAVCNDGTYSYSQSRSGTCSWHGGVAEWY